MKIVNRNKIVSGPAREIIDTENHHNHIIIIDKHGLLRWKENPEVIRLIEKIDINRLCELLIALGHGKNSEVYRKLYRDIGASLYAYWEVFFWEVNNEHASSYNLQGMDSWRIKAERWDMLEDEVSRFYCNKEGEYDAENPERKGDLTSIGEETAMAMGWLT